MQKKWLAWVMAGVMAVSCLTGCGGNRDTAQENESPETSTEEYSIGCSFDYLSDFMATVVDGVNAAASDCGVSVSMQDADFDVSKQLQQVENFISKGIDAVVIKPVDSEACGPISEACAKANVPLIVVNSPIASDCDSFIGSDNVYAGQLQGEFVTETLPEGGKVAFLLGTMQYEATADRTDGAKEALEKAGNFEVVTEQDGGWMRDQAMDIVENWLNSDLGFDVIISNNDEMAIGACMVLDEAGRKDDIVVCGIDASADGLASMKNGLLDMTVFQNGYDQGYQCIETAIKLIEGESVEEYVDVPFEPVTPDNMNEYTE